MTYPQQPDPQRPPYPPYQQSAYAYPISSEAPKPSQRNKVLKRIAYIAVVLLAFFIGVAAGSATASSSNNAAASPGPTVTVTAAGQQPTTKPKPKPTATKPAGPATSFGDGTWEVRNDIAPGTYKVTVPNDSVGCYWEREKNLDGSFDSIISNDNLNPGARGTVTIKSTDKGFKSDGCGTWHRS